MYYSKKDIKKLVTKMVIRFLVGHPDYVLNNTSYGSSLRYEVGCESLDGKKVIMFGLQELEDINKYALVSKEYDSNEKDYKIISYFWLIDSNKIRFTDDEETYRKIASARASKKRIGSFEPTAITVLTYNEPLFDKFARLYFNKFRKQFKGKVITCKKNQFYSYTCKKYSTTYYVEYIYAKNKIQTIYLH